MGRIDRMLAELCPEGVPMVQLQDCADIGTGSHNTQDGLTEGEYPFYTRGQEVLRLNDFDYDETAIITAGDGAGVGKVFHFVKGKYALHQRAYRIVANDRIINPLFLYFHIQNNFYDYIMKSSVSSSVTSVRKPMLLTYPIPLPPLPVQEAIVEILDKFDRLSAELQAELQARKQQYEYYRNQLLTRFAPEQPVTEYSLGELGTITRGNGLQKKDFTESGVGCIHYGQIYTRYKTFTENTLTFVDESLAKKLLHVEKGDLVIACTSENVEDVCKCVAWLGEDTIVTGGHACVYRHNQNPKYMAYFFQTDYFFQQKKKYAYGAKVIDIKPDSIAKITIPLPSLEEQARIVAILDKFEALVNDLSQGLPAEIAAVQEQYEYYRNKLLTFKTKE